MNGFRLGTGALIIAFINLTLVAALLNLILRPFPQSALNPYLT